MEQVPKFFEIMYIARKWYIDAKGQTHEYISKITKADLNMYLLAMDAKAAQDNKEHNEYI